MPEFLTKEINVVLWAALQHGGWSFDASDGDRPEPAALQAELEATERQLAALGIDNRTLHTRLDITSAVLRDAERQLWAEALDLYLDRMNIQCDRKHAAARPVSFQELHNAKGRRAVMLLVAITLADLPRRDD